MCTCGSRKLTVYKERFDAMIDEGMEKQDALEVLNLRCPACKMAILTYQVPAYTGFDITQASYVDKATPAAKYVKKIYLTGKKDPQTVEEGSYMYSELIPRAQYEESEYASGRKSDVENLEFFLGEMSMSVPPTLLASSSQKR